MTDSFAGCGVVVTIPLEGVEVDLPGQFEVDLPGQAGDAR